MLSGVKCTYSGLHYQTVHINVKSNEYREQPSKEVYGYYTLFFFKTFFFSPLFPDFIPLSLQSQSNRSCSIREVGNQTGHSLPAPASTVISSASGWNPLSVVSLNNIKVCVQCIVPHFRDPWTGCSAWLRAVLCGGTSLALQISVHQHAVGPSLSCPVPAGLTSSKAVAHQCSSNSASYLGGFFSTWLLILVPCCMKTLSTEISADLIGTTYASACAPVWETSCL